MYTESKIESWLGLEINREKTKVINLRQSGESMDFPGINIQNMKKIVSANQRSI